MHLWYWNEIHALILLSNYIAGEGADLWVEGQRLRVIGVNDWWVRLKDDALTRRLKSSTTHSHKQVHHLRKEVDYVFYFKDSSLSTISGPNWGWQMYRDLLFLHTDCLIFHQPEEIMITKKFKNLHITFYRIDCVVTSAPVATSSAAPDITPSV